MKKDHAGRGIGGITKKQTQSKKSLGNPGRESSSTDTCPYCAKTIPFPLCRITGKGRNLKKMQLSHYRQLRPSEVTAAYQGSHRQCGEAGRQRSQHARRRLRRRGRGAATRRVPARHHLVVARGQWQGRCWVRGPWRPGRCSTTDRCGPRVSYSARRLSLARRLCSRDERKRAYLGLMRWVRVKMAPRRMQMPPTTM